MIHLCEYCALHGADDGYCSDVCRRSRELYLAAARLVQQAERGKRPLLRRLARAVDALRPPRRAARGPLRYARAPG
jgi:hypothetical protein